jgi:hypothetical protein
MFDYKDIENIDNFSLKRLLELRCDRVDCDELIKESYNFFYYIIFLVSLFIFYKIRHFRSKDKF